MLHAASPLRGAVHEGGHHRLGDHRRHHHRRPRADRAHDARERAQVFPVAGGGAEDPRPVDHQPCRRRGLQHRREPRAPGLGGRGPHADGARPERHGGARAPDQGRRRAGADHRKRRCGHRGLVDDRQSRPQRDDLRASRRQRNPERGRYRRRLRGRRSGAHRPAVGQFRRRLSGVRGAGQGRRRVRVGESGYPSAHRTGAVGLRRLRAHRPSVDQPRRGRSAGASLRALRATARADSQGRARHDEARSGLRRLRDLRHRLLRRPAGQGAEMGAHHRRGAGRLSGGP